MATGDSADRIKNLKLLNDSIQKQLDLAKSTNDVDRERALLGEKISNYEKVITDLKKEQLDKGIDNIAQIEKLQVEQQQLVKTEKDLNKQLDEGIKRRTRQVNLAKELGAQLKIGWKYLQEQDKIIKTTNLNLGMSGNKAVMMRDAFEKSSKYVLRLGGTIGDIQGVMQGYADETGRARVMTAEMVQDITDIGKGTGLGIAEATRLGAQFELMGYSAKGMVDYVQGVVDTSERMGVNTTKVLKNVNDNFKKLNTYTFQQGVKGFAQMAMYAEKFKIDIGDALNAADVARTLEGAIDLSAQLQVMGGEFAKTDPFELLYLGRNDPAKMQEKLADMTKGLVTFRKNSEGVMEKFISPADRDRMFAVEKSLNMEAGSMVVIAERQAEVQKMRQQMSGLGLSAEQKEVIEGAALWDQKAGKFQVQLGETMLNIGELTKDQAKAFKTEQLLLKDRATEAMTFDETFKATIEILKSALLPLLKGVNWMLDKFMKPIANFAAKGWGGAVTAAAALMSAGLLWKGVTSGLGRLGTKWIAEGGGKGFLGGMLGGKGSAAGKSAGGAIIGRGADYTGTGQIRKGAAGLHKAKGMKSLATGGAIGAAAVGMGAGVGLAAVGISKLADSMSKLTPEQAEILKSIAMTLAVTFPLAAIGIGIVAAVAAPAAIPLLALGAALLMMGGAIGIAAGGIGFMAKGFATLFDSIKGVENIGEVTAGLAGMMAVLTTATIALPAAIGLGFAISKIGKHADDLVKVGAAFQNIQTVMSGSRDDFIAVQNAVESISNMNTKGGGMLADLARLLRKPLQVEFAKGNVMLHNDITLDIDKTTFMRKIYDPEIAIQMQESLRIGKGR